MNYLAIHVTTGKEVQVAAYIKNALSKLWDMERYDFLRGMQVLHFSKAVTIVEGEKVRTTSKAELPGYVYVAFHEWDNHLYHLLKSVPGVIKLLLRAFSTQQEIDKMKVDLECEVHLVVPDSQVNDVLIDKLVDKNERVKDRQVKRNKLLRRLISMPMEFFKSLVKEAAEKSDTWLDSMLARPDRLSPFDVVAKGRTILKFMDAEWLLKWLSKSLTTGRGMGEAIPTGKSGT